MKKKTTKQTIDQRIAAREQQLNQTFAEMVSVIDDYVKISPMVFLHGGDGAPGQYLLRNYGYEEGGLNKFHKWIEVWMRSLFPRTLTHQKKICQTSNALDDEYMEICYDAQHFG